MTTLPSGAADTGDPMDDVPETFSFVYPDRDFASSEISVTSYKTERTVNSRKSRYNVRPRPKYADCGPSHLKVPQNLTWSDVDDSEVRKSMGRRENQQATLTFTVHGWVTIKSSQRSADLSQSRIGPGE